MGTDKTPTVTHYMEKALGTRALNGVSHQILSLGVQGTLQERGGKSVRTRGDRGHQEDTSFKKTRKAHRLKSKHRAFASLHQRLYVCTTDFTLVFYRNPVSLILVPDFRAFSSAGLSCPVSK